MSHYDIGVPCKLCHLTRGIMQVYLLYYFLNLGVKFDVKHCQIFFYKGAMKDHILVISMFFGSISGFSV